MKILKNPSGVSWNTIDWPLVERLVFKQQKKIYKASKAGNIKLVRQLQDLLCKSSYAKWVAIKQTTHYTKRNKVPPKFLENACQSFLLSPEEKMSLVPLLKFPVSNLSLQRVWIPKPQKVDGIFVQTAKPFQLTVSKERVQRFVQPGMSIICNRCMQTLLKLALEPEWEAKFEDSSYGFRPGRNYHHALKAIRTTISQRPYYLISTQISKIFDKIDHTALLNKTGLTGKYRQTLKNWLKAGLFNEEILLDYQNGFEVVRDRNECLSKAIIAPLLVNIAFYGLGDYLEKNRIKLTEGKENKRLDTPSTENFCKVKTLLTNSSFQQSIVLIRYGRNFLVFHSDKKIVLACNSKIREFFSNLGLILKRNQLQLSHTLELNLEDTIQEGFRESPGFEFLGFKIQQFKTKSKPPSAALIVKQNFDKIIPPNVKRGGQAFQTRIWPSQGNCNLHQRKLHRLILSNQGLKLSQEVLIKLLNPIIGKWGSYFGRSDVKTIKTLAKMDFLLYLKLKKWGLKKTGSTKIGLRKYWTTTSSDSDKRIFANSTKSVILRAHTDYSNALSLYIKKGKKLSLSRSFASHAKFFTF